MCGQPLVSSFIRWAKSRQATHLLLSAQIYMELLLFAKRFSHVHAELGLESSLVRLNLFKNEWRKIKLQMVPFCYYKNLKNFRHSRSLFITSYQRISTITNQIIINKFLLQKTYEGNFFLLPTSYTKTF